MKETKEPLVLVNFRITEKQRSFIKKIADKYNGESRFVRFLLEQFISNSKKK